MPARHAFGCSTPPSTRTCPWERSHWRAKPPLPARGLGFLVETHSYWHTCGGDESHFRVTLVTRLSDIALADLATRAGWAARLEPSNDRRNRADLTAGHPGDHEGGENPVGTLCVGDPVT